MRILFISGLYPPFAKGGAELSTALTAQALARRGHEITILTEGEKKLEEHIEGVRVQRYPFGLTKKVLFEGRQAQRLARRFSQSNLRLSEFDVIHAHDFRSGLALSKISHPRRCFTHRDYAAVCGTTNNVLSSGERCTCSLRDIWQCRRVQEVSGLRRFARMWQFWHNTAPRGKMLAQIPNHIFISHAEQHELEHHPRWISVTSGAQAHRKVIYNPVPENYLTEPRREGTAGRVMYIGRVEEYKGVWLLLKAWRGVIRRIPHAHLTIVGEGAQKGEYERWAATHGLSHNLTFRGRIPWQRVMSLYDEAEIIVSPHVWVEPFGRSVVEALARGKIVVAANRGGPAELIQDGRNGMLFSWNLESALAERLCDALSLPRLRARSIGEAARSWARQHTAPAIIAAEYEEFYQEIVSQT